MFYNSPSPPLFPLKMTTFMAPVPLTAAPTEVKGTTGRLVREIEGLKNELAQLEQEEERIKKAKTAEYERKEHERRRKQQLEEEAKIRETIELRKYQEEQRKERLKRMREEARQQEFNRQQKEKQFQQIQWELAAAKTPAEIENTLKKKKEMEDLHRDKVKVQDTEMVATRIKLTNILEDMRKELQELGQDDWMLKINAKKAKQEKRLEHERALREQEIQSTAAGKTSRSRKMQHERCVIRNEISALRDEMRMLERDENMENMRRAAREQHLSETKQNHALSQDETTRVTRERQQQQAEEEEWSSSELRKKDIAQQEYILEKQLAQQRIGQECSEKRTVEIEALKQLRAEERALMEEQEAEAVEGIHKELELVATLQSQPVKQSIRELIQQQRELDQDVPLEDIIKYSAEVSNMYSQLAAEEITESKKRLAMLRHEQAVQQERSAVLKLEADRARDRERMQAEHHRIKSEEERKQRVIDMSCHEYEANMAAAQRERDVVRDETQHSRALLRELEAEEAEMQATRALNEEVATENQIRQAEGKLLDHNAAKRRAESDTAALKRAARELECEQEMADRRRLTRERERQEAAALTLQGFAKIILSKRIAHARRTAKQQTYDDSVTHGAVVVSQMAYRKKASVKDVELKKKELDERREAKAAAIVQRMEEEEEAARVEAAAAQQEVKKEVHDSQSQTVPSRPATAEKPKQEDPGDRLTDLENKVVWLKQQLDDEREYHMQRDNERRILTEQANGEQIDLLQEERDLQTYQIDELTNLLAEHTTLIQSLQDQLHEATRFGPYEEDYERGLAAEKIQARWKGFQVRRHMAYVPRTDRASQQDRLMQNEAAVVIQGMLRTSTAKALKDDKQAVRETYSNQEIRDEAATNIQRIVRGNHGRQKV